MNSMETDFRYLLDGEPVTAMRLIDEACVRDDNFAQDWIKQTSVAAAILRRHGFEVSDMREKVE